MMGNDSGVTPEKAYLIGTILGICIGALFCLFGVVITILGFSGSVQWILKGPSFTSRLVNAGPGVVFAALGVVVLWRYKPKVSLTEQRCEDADRSYSETRIFIGKADDEEDRR